MFHNVKKKAPWTRGPYQTKAYFRETCECVECCNGEHPGFCRECVGWGDWITDDGIVDCDYCFGTGTCPKCDGACRKDEG